MMIELNQSQIEAFLSGGFIIAYSQAYRPCKNILERLRKTNLKKTAVFIKPGKHFDDNLRLEFRDRK